MARDADGIIQIKWANSGDVGLGGLDVNEMWDITYSQPGGPLPQRIQFNQFYRWLSALAVEINQNGPFLEYSALIDYTVGSWVTGSDGFQYYCRVANGPTSSVVDPVGNTTEWKKGSNNDTLVIGADGAIDGTNIIQIADPTSSEVEISTGGTGGQGAARRSMFFNNTNAQPFMDIDCYDVNTSLGIKLRINPNGGEVGIGTVPTSGKALHVNGDVLFNDAANMLSPVVVGGNGSIIDTGQLQVAHSTLGSMEISTGGANGQGSARKAMRFLNGDASDYMDIDCYDFDAVLPVKLALNITGGEVGIGTIPTTGVELDVAGDIAASGTVSSSGKVLVSDSSALKDNTTGETITTTPTTFSTINLGTLAIGDSFMVSWSMTGSRTLAAIVLEVLISNSGTGQMSGPLALDQATSHFESAQLGAFANTFSCLFTVVTAGTVIINNRLNTDTSTITAAATGINIQFFRKA